MFTNNKNKVKMTNRWQASLPVSGRPASVVLAERKLTPYVYAVDILLYLLQHYPNLTTATTAKGDSLLSLLAATPLNFLSANKLGFWESCIYSVIPVRKSYEPPNSVRKYREEGSQHLSGTCPPSVQLADQG
ncbi:hypothetical protein TIFTF001_022144 [Ficus carica]|uniref:Uncharacterized protein n=1 Tax=Ficus carica TaxID=3494 RepID=A0AA88DBF9_FICCA|nr:hypothetical protein TIFTF001_022144 [Ficus carica]